MRPVIAIGSISKITADFDSLQGFVGSILVLFFEYWGNTALFTWAIIVIAGCVICVVTTMYYVLARTHPHVLLLRVVIGKPSVLHHGGNHIVNHGCDLDVHCIVVPW